ncbi:protein MTSS 1 isoform X3 [Poecilia formosa]|uniref:protein MTSS 1 isoform X3 n=1 Tax=Poecilia formosa TaxID=48698 RepID=UPI0007B848B6|nr:PREDICTED: MTSS1-like protein isoform X3 [Poecilia formosa]
MDAGIEKECSALGGLFQLIMSDMKASYPTWEDFVSKGAKLQAHLRTTLLLTGAFLDAFQKVADMATGTRGATKEIGSALTRMCMRHRSIESKLKLFTIALSESLIVPLELKMEEWKKAASQLDKDHAKEYKKARADIKKKSSDTIKLQKKVKKGKGDARGQLDCALQDVNTRYAALEETEKRAVCRALVEERSRYCSFVSMLKPVLDHEINMLGEVTHLQTILEDLSVLTAEPTKLPAASEQVILDLKGSDFNYTYQTPPGSPGNMSRKSSISSYQSVSVRHVPSLDSISCAVDGVHLQPATPYLLYGCDEGGRSLSEGNSPSRISRHGNHSPVAGYRRCGAQSRRVSRRDDAVVTTQPPAGGAENGLLPPPHSAYIHHHGERARAMSASGKSCSARDQLALTLGALNSDAPRSSRDSLHCSSGYSTQTTTPSCSEDTIHTHTDYESISLHGDADSAPFHQLCGSRSDLDKSSTLPRNSDLRFQFRDLAQSKRPTSTVSLLADGELSGGGHQHAAHTATIRRKPSSKPAYRRGTISGGMPIPISTPQVPLRAGDDDAFFRAPPAGGLGHSKLCTSTQSLVSLPSSSSPYYQLVPGHMPVPAVPPLPPGGGSIRQQQQRLQLQHQQNQQQQFEQHAQQQLQQNQLQQPQEHLQQHQLQQHNQQHVQLQQQSQQLQQHQLQQQSQQLQQHQLQQHNQQHVQLQQHQLQQQSQQLQLQLQNLHLHNQQLQHCSPAAAAPPPISNQQDTAGADMLTLIRKVKLKRTLTNDRSAPMLPPPGH